MLPTVIFLWLVFLALVVVAMIINRGASQTSDTSPPRFQSVAETTREESATSEQDADAAETSADLMQRLSDELEPVAPVDPEIESLVKRLDKSPGDHEVRRQLIDLYLQHNDSTTAVQQLYILAEMLEEEADEAGARETYQRILELDADSVRAQEKLGLIQRTQWD